VICVNCLTDEATEHVAGYDVCVACEALHYLPPHKRRPPEGDL
jgi:hypothetical protein